MIINKPIKYKGSWHAAGADITISKEDWEEFIRLNIINEENIKIEKNEVSEPPIINDLDDTYPIPYDKITKPVLGQILTERGIDYSERESKETLYNLYLEMGE